MLRLRTFAALTAIAALATFASACGSSGSGSSSDTAGATTAAGEGGSGTTGGESQTTAAAGGEACGTIPTRMPADPEGVLKQFPESVREAFDLYSEAPMKSAWANWKPADPGPYTIALLGGEFEDPFGAEAVAKLKELDQESDLVGEVKFLSANLNAQTQVQQIQQAVREKVDLLIVFPVSVAASAHVVEAAGKAGIPVIEPLNVSDNPYVIGLDGNELLKGATLMSSLAQIMGGEGGLVEMQGVPGLAGSEGPLEGANAVVDDCPDIEIVGKPVGEYSPSTAKTQMLQFLSAHPQPVGGAIQVGGMATGMIQAFEQTGREVPPIADLGASPGHLAYWSEHKGDYKGVAIAMPPAAQTEAMWTLATGLLEGRGLKINTVLQAPVVIDEENLDEWVEPDWTLETPLAYAPGPPGAYYPAEYVEQFFVKAK
jgi:ribose transport system substrate-binding protein